MREQKRYLKASRRGPADRAGGRGSGLRSRRGAATRREREPVGPDAGTVARRRTASVAAGGKLTDQEKFKREQHPFDAYARLKEQAANNEFPKPADNFRWRYYGLFYVAPAQNSYMCRLRMPNGILKHWQFAGLADLAERYGGGYSHVTTRANLQIREIEPKNAVAMLEAIQDLGLCSRGSGADNIRNVTGTPTAGIDPQELIDTRPYAREWHFHILNERALYGLPRKFNVAFDGAGRIPVLEDTNDIGFQAVEVKDGFGVEPGVWFRLALGGITGHKDFARDTGVIVKPADATKVADAIVRVFIDHGDRTNRNKARLKYVLDAMGFDKFLALVEEKLGCEARRACRPRRSRRGRRSTAPPISACIRRSRTGLHWIGVVLPVGKLTAAQMRGLAAIAQRDGRRRYPPHGLAEPADLRRPDRQARARRSRDRGARALHQGDARSAPASSPAPATPAASSPPPTPSATPRRSRAGARRASSSTARSTSISPAAIIPARSITSATSACSPARCRPPRTATPSRAITSWSAAASGRTRRSRARSTATSRPRTRRRPSSACSRPISRTAPRATRPSRRSRAATRSTR